MLESAMIHQQLSMKSKVYDGVTQRAFSHAARAEHRAYKTLESEHDHKIRFQELKNKQRAMLRVIHRKTHIDRRHDGEEHY